MGAFEGYTLGDVIEDYAKSDQILHIGTKDGSGFFFIGTKAELYESIPRLEEFSRKSIGDSLRKLRSELIATDNARYADDIKPEKLRQYNGKCEELTKKILRIEEQSRTKLMDRQIVDVYPRLLGDGIVMIIEGGECGRFWFRYEYTAKNSGALKGDAIETDNETGTRKGGIPTIVL